MGAFSAEEHTRAVVRRRIKFVVEKGAMARLFRKGTHAGLQEELARRISLQTLANIRSRDDYDNWLNSVVEDQCWECYSQNGLDSDRWGYFAKLVNIIVYEIVTSHELFSKEDWERLRAFLHVPIDSNVWLYVFEIDNSLPAIKSLKGMTKDQYWDFQKRFRTAAEREGVPPIWFEAAWSGE